METEDEHLAWLLRAGQEADEGDWGEDLTGLTADEMIEKLTKRSNIQMITHEQIKTKAREMCIALDEDPDAPPPTSLIMVNGKQTNLNGWRKYEDFARQYVAANSG